MSRQDELMELFNKADDDTKVLVGPLIEEIQFIETLLADLKTKPFTKTNPKYPNMTKPTPESRMYKEFLSQYNNLINTVDKILNKNKSNGEDANVSPFRKYMNGGGFD